MATRWGWYQDRRRLRIRLIGLGVGVVLTALVSLTLAGSDPSAEERPRSSAPITGSTADAVAPGTSASANAPDTTTSARHADTTTTAAGVASAVEASPGQPTAPVTAAFFYPWFPQGWNQQGANPFTNFTPSLGYYDSNDAAVIDQQLILARRAGIEAFISSWWGQGHHTDTALGSLLERTSADGSPNPGLRWAPYYEPEGQGDPSAETIAADLRYVATRYATSPAYLRVGEDPVLFVWAESGEGAEVAGRWAEAQRLIPDVDFHIVLKVLSGYRDVADQPDSWHQYGPAKAYDAQLPHSVTVSPGFWKYGEDPRLARDVDRFRQDLSAMKASGAFWQLVTSWNEWGEGTAIEPTAEYGEAYISALSEVYGPALAATPTSTAATVPAPTVASGPPSSPSGSLLFTAVGDYGATANTTATLNGIAASGARFNLALGDLSYSQRSPADWCEYVKSNVGATFPFELVLGNHEDDDRVDGYIGDFLGCLPDRMGATGTYGAEYFFDVDGLVRVVMIGAGNDMAGEKYDYKPGSTHLAWLVETVRDARANGIAWVVVGMHKVCLSIGNKSCEVGEALMDTLIAEGVDVVLSGHDHSYQRTHQLRCADAGAFVAGCIADAGDDGQHGKGQGTVFVTVGVGGRDLTPIELGDPELAYFAGWNGRGSSEPGYGFVALQLTAERLAVNFVGSTTTFSDGVVIG